MIDLEPMLEAIAERMDPLPGVEIMVNCPPDIALVSNRALLEQAISNVVRNSVKYTEHGTIKLVAAPRDSRVGRSHHPAAVGPSTAPSWRVVSGGRRRAARGPVPAS